LALAVWHRRPAEFEAYHGWLMQGRQVPPFEEAARRAVELLGKEHVDAAVNQADLTRRIEQYVELFGASGKKLPALMVGGKLIRGVPGPVREWFGFFEGHLKMKPLM
jgi:hypothetical protein